LTSRDLKSIVKKKKTILNEVESGLLMAHENYGLQIQLVEKEIDNLTQ